MERRREVVGAAVMAGAGQRGEECGRDVEAVQIGEVGQPTHNQRRTCVRNWHMEWVRTWLVTTWRTDHLAKVEQVARTVAELRALIADARADPLVRRWEHKSRCELVGDPPTHCGCGRAYRTRGSLPTPHEWLDCGCGGHFWWGCPACPAERVDPPLAYDCQPRWPRRRG